MDDTNTDLARALRLLDELRVRLDEAMVRADAQTAKQILSQIEEQAALIDSMSNQ